MVRVGLTSANQNALKGDIVRCAILASMELSTTPPYVLRLWTGIGDIVIGGHTYLGNGWLLPLKNITETTESQATGLEVSITGVGSDITALALGAVNQKLKGMFYIAVLHSDGSLIADPHLIFKGNLDTVNLEDSPEGSLITITYESDWIKMNRAKAWRYTHEDQNYLFPGDTGFRYAADLSEQNFFWGRKEKKKDKSDLRRNNGQGPNRR